MALKVERLGVVPYGDALDLQAEAVAARREGRSGDRLLLLEHPPVVTLGRSTREENLLVSRAELVRRGIEVHEVARGGDVTYHAPGQLVGYPIVDLDGRGRDVHRFLRDCEGALIDALAELGLAACRVEGKTGVFVAEGAPGDEPLAACLPLRKIASIGVGVRRWVTCHGFALNASLDLGGFSVIVPCGLEDVTMTSVERERGAAVAPEEVDSAVARAFEARFA